MALVFRDAKPHNHEFVFVKGNLVVNTIHYQACVLRQDFWFLEIKVGVTKESSATGYKYIDRSIHKRVFFVNQA